nr:unnamed protein product [Callosobruchus analis]
MEMCSLERKFKILDKIQLHISGLEYTVNIEDVSPETTLNSYLREKTHLTGTKRMCLEGGCGTCVVAVEEEIDGQRNVFAVNSCLVSILSCHGWKIYTIEGIGGPLQGFHPAQTTLARGNGTQCGFCSPGMVMNMFALMEGHGKQLSETTVENSFGGVLCRCTGYRPIVQSFRSLVKKEKGEIKDIEDLKPCKIDGKCRTDCKQKCKQENYYHSFRQSKWMKVHNINDLLDVLISAEDASYRLVGGNTAKGVYYVKNPPQLYIDITSVKELTTFYADSSSLILGANVTLNKTIEIFNNAANEYQGFQYLKDMAQHIEMVATVPVRNIGTIAGNLMIKHKHNEFPSDIFLIMETFRATLSIVDTNDEEILCSPQDFLRINMSKRVIKHIILKPIDKTYQWITYKIMPRAQNAHADVNAGFLFKLTSDYVVESATIVYGGISARFIHASKTEELLKGKTLFDNNTLAQAYQLLDTEIQPTWELPEATPTYRKSLAIALFYKFILKKCPKELLTSSRLTSGGTILQRPLSVAIQEYGTNPQNYPLSEPVPKIEAMAQTSGQAEYCADLPDLPKQTFGAFVTADAVANSHIDQIDASDALDLPGVIALFTEKDIPGTNTFQPKMMGTLPVREELFCSGRVQYYYQPIGLIVADSQETALKAAEMVKIKYTAPTETTFLNVKQVVEANAKNRMKHNTNFVPKKKGKRHKKVINGDYYMSWQYHFHMEVQCCQVVPTEDGLDLFPASQWMDLAQLAAAEALAIPTQTINVTVRRLGGGFGAKISRSALLSTAAALAAYKLRRPVKIWLPFITNMNLMGKRYPLLCRYEVAVNAQGVIQYLKAGTLEGMGSIESIFEQISYELNLDPVQVRLANTDKIKHAKIMDYWKDIQTWADIPARQQAINNFNKQNRWKKKGMSLIPMAWTLEFSANFSVLVSIVHGDGGIMVSHGGIEMGQGINTKVCN